ncbi:uncharacterized protein LOC128219874 isoform X1 [Mya arenaria]|uniref:uncharacterized protein LOC128219874 isoform X1 n=1 Tax=Mya arenaria TaxID=6604 RepID=UPI0022E42E3D|nr:uncharacterized protein LOC128219874 isoform X1 [Mya arenaria]XP_052783970.1 uncharacterized protein LOC128219874 isoform X1 [Mya arenaria]
MSKPDEDTKTPRESGLKGSQEQSFADLRETGACGNGKANVPDLPHTSNKVTGSRPSVESSDFRETGACGNGKANVPDLPHTSKKATGSRPLIDTTQKQCMRRRDASGDENDGASLIGKTFGDDEKQNNGQVEQRLLPKDNCNTILTLDMESEKNKETDSVKTPEKNGYTSSMQSLNWVIYVETDAIVAPVAFASNDRDLSAQNGDNEREVRTNVLRQTGISSETPTPLTNVLTVAVQTSDAPNDDSLGRNEVGFVGLPSVRNAVVYNGRCTEEDIEVDDLESPINVFEGRISCLACQRSARNTVIRPCGHRLFCMNCAQRIRTCWQCGVAILQMIRINTNQ